MNNKLLASQFEIKFFTVLGAILVGIILTSFFISHQVLRKDISSPAKVVISPFENLNLTAQSAFVYDVRMNKVLFEKNADERLPLASLTKVMTALVAKSSAPENTTIVITGGAIRSEGDSGLRVGEKWSLDNLLDFLLTSSSNDGATAVALAFGPKKNFITQMNTKADELGMKNTYYLNETGVDLPVSGTGESTMGGAYGTARDTATMFAYILKNYPDMLSATTKAKTSISSQDKIAHIARNTDLIAENIPGIKGSKTGFTDLAGGNLIVAFDPEIGRPIIISVLGSTTEDRFTDVEKLVEATFVEIQN